MSKHVLSVFGAAILTLALAAVALAQVTTTTVTKTVQNPDGTYTVIEYPAKKEIQINLTPVNVTGATGVATILRDDRPVNARAFCKSAEVHDKCRVG